jgi:D-alanyl-D-alanine carboxypeptidase (penicillin-binding protein 5/6)
MGHSVELSAKSAIVIDAVSGKILWAKDADALRYPASTTKIMTGMLLLEHCKADDIIVAPLDVTKVREASMHLKPGERVAAHDMLYALMLRSANDGCYAVARHISGSVEAFSKLMNWRAKEIGCTHTHFDNPNGLNDPIHYTTAHDLALMGREAMKYPAFRQAVRTYKYEIQRSSDSRDRLMVNHDKYLLKDPSADGIKTGYTVPAGHCFVGSCSRNGFHVITVVMKSDHWQLDHQALLHWAFGKFQLKDRFSAGK